MLNDFERGRCAFFKGEQIPAPQDMKRHLDPKDQQAQDDYYKGIQDMKKTVQAVGSKI